MKKTSWFVLLMLITVLGTGTASFAACTTTSLSAGNGTWGVEAYGQDISTSQLDNILLQVTFVSGGTFTGTEWQSVAGAFTGPTAISGTWSMGSPAADCQGTFTVTSPSTQTFNFSLNNGAKGATLVQLDAGYDIAGFMVAQGTVTCSSALFKNKQVSLYSYGYIPLAGGLVTGEGELKFSSTGTSVTTLPTVTLDLNGAGNLVLTGSGTASVGANCQGSGSLATVAGTFDTDTVVVDGGKEILWIVTNSGDNVSGYFLE